MKRFWLGFGCGIATLALLGIALNVFWDKILENRHDQESSDHYRWLLSEMVERLQSTISSGRTVQVTAESIAKYPSGAMKLPIVDELEKDFVFFTDYTVSALLRHERAIPVVAEKLGHYEKLHGAWVGFVDPAQVRWLDEPEYRNLLERAAPRNKK